MMIPIQVQQLLPEELIQELMRVEKSVDGVLEEIRIRVGKRVDTIFSNGSHLLLYEAKPQDSIFILNRLSQYSIYTIEEELKRGYVTIQGGHRIGLAGRVIIDNGHVKMIRDISSYNIRIAREAIGVGKRYLPYLYNQGWLNTIVIGPPQSGKTTLIRDFARSMSMGEYGYSPVKVGIVDERSEIAGSVKGIPTFELGQRIDVLDACPKSEGMMMMIRSMSPNVLVVDEIGREEDGVALIEAIHAGVTILVTAHGKSIADLKKRPTLARLFQEGVFERVILLGRSKNEERVQEIYNGDGHSIYKGRCVPI